MHASIFASAQQSLKLAERNISLALTSAGTAGAACLPFRSCGSMESIFQANFIG